MSRDSSMGPATGDIAWMRESARLADEQDATVLGEAFDRANRHTPITELYGHRVSPAVVEYLAEQHLASLTDEDLGGEAA